jgi:hypothetical protein
LEIPSNKTAILINNTIIPKQNWHLHYLNEADDILIISKPKLVRLLGLFITSPQVKLKMIVLKASSVAFLCLFERFSFTGFPLLSLAEQQELKYASA